MTATALASEEPERPKGDVTHDWLSVGPGTYSHLLITEYESGWERRMLTIGTKAGNSHLYLGRWQ